MAEVNIPETLCSDEEHKSEKIVYKRRSSIFCTRVTACDQYKDKTARNETELVSNVNREEYMDSKTFNLKEYIEKLRQERKDWQQEYRNRKNQRKTLIHKANIEARGQILDMNILTESERAFLAARPNYERVCRNSQRLSDVTLQLSTVSQLVQSLNQRFMDKMENNISVATKNVIKISEQSSREVDGILDI